MPYRLRRVIIDVVIHIPNWLERPIVFIVLLYRRLRFGYPFRRIPLSQGKFAIVDPEDYPRLAKHKWYAAYNGHSFYAIRGQWSPIRKRRLTISMHRIILNVHPSLYVDHINRNGLDNRKANLRPATPADNSRNARHPKINTSSKYRGVFWNPRAGNWRAAISVNHKKKHIGYFNSETQAAKAYDRAARKYHSQFAVVNFPVSPSR